MEIYKMVAEKLGVEMGVPFDVVGVGGKFVIYDELITWMSKEIKITSEFLDDILSGKYTVKSHWKPKLGEKFWVVEFSPDLCVDWVIREDIEWCDRIIASGNYYKTEEEAEEVMVEVDRVIRRGR